MTLYVESNFLLEIVLGQEEAEPADHLLSMAREGNLDMALPSYSLNEPIIRVNRGARDRKKLMNELNNQVEQLGRTAPHAHEVNALRSIPDLFSSIEQREKQTLIDTVSRLLDVARLLELNSTCFISALEYRARFDLELDDAIVLALVISDLQAQDTQRPHLFANRNRKDFDDPSIVGELNRLGCQVVWSFSDALRIIRSQSRNA